MSDLLTEGTSSYLSSGTPDTQTARSNGVNGSFADAEMVNGVAKAMVDVQTLLGNALTLKGQMNDLASRLQRILESDGAIRKGTGFPSTPVPVKGDLFYRTDINTLYAYDGATWRTMFEGAGGTTIDHGSIAGLADDDHTLYVLADGTRIITGNQQFKKSVPIIRLKGTEANAQEYGIGENGGDLYLYENTGTDGSPTWTARARYDRTNTKWVLTGDLSVSGSILTPNILTPTINSFANAGHDHSNAANGYGLGGNTVLRATLKTAVGGISGNHGSGSTVNVAMDAYSFFPMVHSEDPTEIRWEAHGTDGTSADSPRFRLRNAGVSTLAYNVDWRYISAS